MTSLPSASDSPNRRSLATVLITTTRWALRDSCSVKARPSTMSGGLICGQFEVNPMTVTLDSVLSRYLACAPHPCCMPTSATDDTRLSASASPKVSCGLERQTHDSSPPWQASKRIGKRCTKKVVGPDDWNCLATLSLIPCTAAEINTTTNTPTATPRIVRLARTLLARMASKAIATPSSDIRIRSLSRMRVTPAAARPPGRATRRGSRDTRPR